jgi:hypothetical protein
MRRLTFDKRRSTKYVLVAFCGAFLINWGFGAAINPHPLGLMKAEVEQLSEKKAENLRVRRGGYAGGFLGRSSYCEFECKRQPGEAVYIELRKPLHLLPWQVFEYRRGE